MVVNNVVNVTYVEQKTQKKVVTRQIARTDDAKQAGKIENDTVEVFEPKPDETPEALAPPEPKPVEEVAKTSETKAQAEGEATTEDALAPPEVEKAVKERKGKGKKAAETGAAGETPAELNPKLPKGKEADTAPPEAKKPKEKPVPAEEIKSPLSGGGKALVRGEA